MGISIDSLDAEKHDIFRGSAGAHAATLAGIEVRKASARSRSTPWWSTETATICDITHSRKNRRDEPFGFFLVPVGRQRHFR